MTIESIAHAVSQHPELYITYAVIIGLFVGSFLNVVGIRLPQGGSIVKPPSHCTSCKHRLAPLELVPVFSYLALRGKCRHCKAKVPPLYALGEAATAAVFGLTAWLIGFRPELLVALTLVSLLIAASIGDLLYRIIPNRLILFGIIAGVLLRVGSHPLPLWNYAVAFLIGGGVLYGIALLSEVLLKKEGMGGGDIKLFAMIGLYVGIGDILLTIFLSSLYGAVYGISSMLVRKDGSSRYIPFGPFIALGAFTVYMWGGYIIEWYGSLLD